MIYVQWRLQQLNRCSTLSASLGLLTYSSGLRYLRNTPTKKEKEKKQNKEEDKVLHTRPWYEVYNFISSVFKPLSDQRPKKIREPFWEST